MESTNPGGISGALSDPKEAGTALLKQGRFDEAAAVLREATVLDNNDEIAWRLLGGALASKGDAQGAITAFQNSVRIVPRAARSHYNLGLAFQSAGRLAEAKSSLEQALALDPGHEPARARLGEVSQQLGQRTPSASAAPVSSEGHTNIGGGNSTGLAGISSPMMQAQSQAQSQADSSGGHTNIGGGNSIGLSSIGALREAPSGGGHSNIGGGSSIGLSSVGMSPQSSAPQETGHTNIGGGNSAMLGSVSSAGGSPSLRPGVPGAPPTSAPPMSAPPISTPPSYQPSGGYIPPPVLGQNYSQDLMNNSGMQGEVPEDVAKPFNWGAFWYTGIWLINMKMPQYGYAVIVGSVILNNVQRYANIPFFGLFLFLAQIGLGIYVGMNGNKLAWQNRVFESKEDFHACQRIWAYWTIGGIVLTLLMFLFIALIFGAVFAGMIGSSGRFRH